MDRQRQIAPGITVSPNGQANIDATLTPILLDLAIALEDSTDLPVDVEHVVAAMVLASRLGELDAHARIASDDAALIATLAIQLPTIFTDYDGRVGRED
jgi:hypothetical protein